MDLVAPLVLLNIPEPACEVRPSTIDRIDQGSGKLLAMNPDTPADLIQIIHPPAQPPPAAPDVAPPVLSPQVVDQAHKAMYDANPLDPRILFQNPLTADTPAPTKAPKQPSSGEGDKSNPGESGGGTSGTSHGNGAPGEGSGMSAFGGSLQTVDPNLSGSSDQQNTSNGHEQPANLAGVATFLDASNTNPANGEPVTLTATVVPSDAAAGTPSGQVTFLLDGNQVLGTANLSGDPENNQAMLTVASLAPGAHQITASYQGDGQFRSERSQTLNLSVDTKYASQLTLDASNANPVYGEGVTVTAKVSARDGPFGTPMGQVTFWLDGNQVLGTASLAGANNQASIDVSGLAVGGHQITATYAGDSGFRTSTQVLNLAVDQSATTITLSPTTPIAGGPVTITAHVAPYAPGAGTPTGTVTFLEGNQVWAVEVLSASEGGVQAAFTSSDFVLAEHRFVAVYSGDGSFRSSTTTAPITPATEPGVTIVESEGITRLNEEEQNSDTYTIVLDSRPTQDVVITLSPDEQVTVLPHEMTFTPDNWNVPQTATVVAVNDLAEEGHHIGAIRHTAASLDPRYDGIAVPTVTAQITNLEIEVIVISNATVTEGNSGITNAVFIVSRTNTMATTSVSYTTMDGTATVADGDYSPVMGSVTIFPGEISKPIPVPVHGDTQMETDETFKVILSNPTTDAPGGIIFFDSEGIGTILNDDVASGTISGVKFNDLNQNAIKDTGEPGLSGWTIFFDNNFNGTFDLGEPFRITDMTGSYSFTNLAAGTCTECVKWLRRVGRRPPPTPRIS